LSADDLGDVLGARHADALGHVGAASRPGVVGLVTVQVRPGLGGRGQAEAVEPGDQEPGPVSGGGIGRRCRERLVARQIGHQHLRRRRGRRRRAQRVSCRRIRRRSDPDRAPLAGGPRLQRFVLAALKRCPCSRGSRRIRRCVSQSGLAGVSLSV